MRSPALVLATIALLVGAAGPSRADDPVAVGFGWSAPNDCRAEVDVTDVVSTAEAVRGRIRHQGAVPIRNVTVCIGRACSPVAAGGVIPTGRSAAFEIRMSRGVNAKAAPSVRCSILETRAGA